MIRKLARLFVCLVMAVVLLAAAIVAGSSWIVDHLAQGRLRTDPASLPKNETALVLGTSSRAGPNANPHFDNRIAAAADLFRRGCVKHLLLSGDHGSRGYDEPSDMRRALLALGVPDRAMTLDYAGFRTLDSVVRARKIFGLDKMVIVTDRFHTSRALFLARQFGIDAVAFPSKDVPLTTSARSVIRECFARVKACLDVYVLHTGPHFLGRKEPIAAKPAHDA